MIDSKTVDLIIQAQLKGKGDLAAITKSIAELEKAIDAQSQAAKRGEASIDELKSTLLALQQAQQQLTQKANLVSQFERAGAAAEKAAERVSRTSKAYEEYQRKLEGVADVTDKQQERLIKLSAAQERAQQAQARAIETQQKLTQALTDAGIATSDLAGAELRIRDAAAQIGVSIGKTQQAISTYATDLRAAKQAQKELADAQAQASRDADLFAKGEQRAADAASARARAAEEAAQSIRDRKANSAASSNEFEQASAEAARARELAALRQDIIKRSEEQAAIDARMAKDNALGKLADNAAQASRQYTTLARASSDLSPKLVSVRDAVDSIVNPTKAAVATIGGVEDRITSLASSIGKINGPVENYRETLTSLNEAQRSLTSQATLIDNFAKQAAALRAAREEFVQARAKVNEYAQAVRQGGDAGQSFVQALNQAQAKAQQAAQAFQNQLQATREAREGLRAAGIASNDLAGSQQRLVAAATQAQTATKALGDAVKQYGLESEKAGGKQRGLFGDEGRTTLSLAQRIRGEILALTASYVGLQGALGLAGDSLDAFNKRAAAKTVIGVGLGTIDKQAIDEEYRYVRAQADRIGLVFDDTVTQFAKFSTAAAKAGRGREEIKFIFESFSEAGRVLGLTQDNLNGVFLALEQIFSKGKISAEELRQQLGERLPAVFQVAQQALKDQFPDLNKAIEQGKVGAENLVLIADAYRKMVAGQLAEATNSLAARQARLTNSINDFKLAIADSGFVDAYATAIERLTAFINSPDGAEFAKGLSEAFQSVLDVVMLVVENFDEFKTVLGGLVAIQVTKMFFDMVTGLNNVRTAAVGAGVALGGIQKAFLVLSALIAGWQIGTYLSEKFAQVRIAGIVLVTQLDRIWTRLKFGAQIAFENVTTFGTNAAIAVENVFNKMIRGIGTLLEGFVRALGNEKLAAAIGRQLGAVVDTAYFDASSRTKQLRSDMEAEIAKINAIEQDMINDAVLQGREGVKLAPRGGATPFPGKPQPTGKTGPSEGEIAKRERAIESIQNRLDALDARINRSSSQTLENQLEAVDLQFKDLASDIEKLGGTVANGFRTRLDKLKTELKAQITTDFSNEILKAQNQLQAKLEQAEAAAGRKSKENLDRRLAAIEKSYADAFRDIDVLEAKQRANNLDTSKTTQVRANMTAVVNELKQIEARKFYEEELNRVIEQRQKLIEAVRASQKAGTIDQDQAAAQINLINTQALPGILAARDAAIQWAQANQAIFGNTEAMNTFIAQITAVAQKAGETKTELTTMQSSFMEGLVNGIGPGIDMVADSFAKMINGQQSVSQGFKGMANSAALFFVSLIQQVAKAILQMLILRALMAATGLGGAAAGAAGAASSTAMAGTAAIPANVAHTGGVVGSSNRSRLASPSWFSNAPRYHSGGIAGLAPDEYATILQKNEEVLTADSPRNILNGGAGIGGQSQQEPTPTRFVLVDDRSKVPEAMASADGERVVMQILQRNVSTVKQMVR